MVPKGSTLEKQLLRRCAGEHEHQPVFGGRSITVKAGQYPWEFVRTMLEAATWQLANDSEALPDLVWSMAQEDDHELKKEAHEAIHT